MPCGGLHSGAQSLSRHPRAALPLSRQNGPRHQLWPLVPLSQKINLSTSLAGQAVGIKEVESGIWLISFMQYDLGYIDLEEKTLQPLDNPFGPNVLPTS